MSYVSAAALAGLKFAQRQEDVAIGDVKFRVVGMSEAERIRFDLWMRDKGGEVSNAKLATSRIKLVTMCVVDSEGKPVFSEDDFDLIKSWPSAVTAKLAAASQRVCGLDDEDLENEVKN